MSSQLRSIWISIKRVQRQYSGQPAASATAQRERQSYLWLYCTFPMAPHSHPTGNGFTRLGASSYSHQRSGGKTVGTPRKERLNWIYIHHTTTIPLPIEIGTLHTSKTQPQQSTRTTVDKRLTVGVCQSYTRVAVFKLVWLFAARTRPTYFMRVCVFQSLSMVLAVGFGFVSPPPMLHFKPFDTVLAPRSSRRLMRNA